MGIYRRSLFKSASDTSLYGRRQKRTTAKSTDRLGALKNYLNGRKCSTGTKFKESVLDKIFDDSSSADDSEKDLKNFIEIFSNKGSPKKGFLAAKSFVGDRFDLVHEKLDVSKQKKMNCRSSSASRNISACFHPCDFYTRRRKREPKSYMHVNSFNHSFDNPSKYRFNRQRSLSPNLPKIPYLEKPPQYVTNTPISPQRKPRINLKGRSCNDRQKLKKNASKKSIPEHALMKNLLSGLSIFENDVDADCSNTKNVHKHKSMGNIRSSTTGNYIFKSNHKSDVDVRDSIAGNSEETSDNFKDYCNGYKRICPKRYEFESYCCKGNGNYANGETNVNFFKEKENQKFQRRNTLVERRRNFFENRKKQMELENVKLKPTALVISCVGRQIQNDEKSDDITEIYRNFQSVHSTSTISKRSSSLPPLSRFRRSSGRNGGELFNPDYNFCCENSGSVSIRNSIIESIRSRVFQTNNNVKREFTDNWNSEPAYIPRFPKETKTAMSIILSNKNSSISCKFCREKFRRTLVSIETQTSPQTSRHEIPQSSEDDLGLPCPKNLLCDKGYHPGNCEESVRRRLNVVCDEHCVCRANRRFLEYGNGLNWPGQAVRLVKNLDSEQDNSSEDFLGLIRLDLDTSEEKIDHQCLHGHEIAEQDLKIFSTHQPSQNMSLKKKDGYHHVDE